MRQLIGLAALIASAVLLTCVLEFAGPSAKSATGANAVVSRSNFSSGPVKTYPAQSALVSTIGQGNAGIPLQLPVSVASDGTGKIWVADYANNWIVCYSAADRTVIKIFGKGKAGSDDGAFNLASFNHPNGLAFSPDGSLYITDMGNNRIRKIDPATNTVSTFAGSGAAGFADGPLRAAIFNLPSGIAIDANGTIYITEEGNNMIRRITNKKTVTRWCGQTTAGSTDGPCAIASFDLPRGIAVAPDGAIYVADQNNNKIRRIEHDNVTTFAGNGQPTLMNGTGIDAAFNHPSDLCTDSAGNIYVADQHNYMIRFITPDAIVSTLAGSLPAYHDDYDSRAEFVSPDGITVDPKGDIYITDQGSATVRKLIFTPTHQYE